MAEQPHSQPQQIFADFWTKAFQDHIARVEAFYAEVGKLEAKGAEQAAKNLDEAARLGKESIAYGNELAAAWRKLTLEATRRTADAFTAATSRG